MNKLLYVSFEDSENLASGVNKKIIGQIKVFENEGISTDLIAHYQSHIAFYHELDQPSIIASKMPWRIALCAWAAQHADKYNIAYIRFQFFCPFVFNMVRAFHKVGVRTIMEIPTYPYITELKKQGLRGVPKRLIDGTFKNACAKYIDCFAAPLYGEPIMGKRCIEIRNGINTDDIQPRQHQKTDQRIHLLAVAMMAPWHGYDRLIEGLKLYYQKKGTEDVVLHLVGQGVESGRYHELIESGRLSNHVIEHGKMFGGELDALYNLADIGVGSLGVHRTEITMTNTLKILEYFAKGLPVICEPSEIGIPLNDSYRLTVQADESPIDIEAIFAFYHRVYQSNDYDKVIQDIREECRRTCSVKSGLQEILDYMEEK